MQKVCLAAGPVSSMQPKGGGGLRFAGPIHLWRHFWFAHTKHAPPGHCSEKSANHPLTRLHSTPPHTLTGTHLGDSITHLVSPQHGGRGYLSAQGVLAVAQNGALYVVNPYTFESAGPLHVEGVTKAGDTASPVAWVEAGVEHTDGSFYVYIQTVARPDAVAVVHVTPRNLSATLLGSVAISPPGCDTSSGCSLHFRNATHWVCLAKEEATDAVCSFVTPVPSTPFAEPVLRAMKAGIEQGRCARVRPHVDPPHLQHAEALRHGRLQTPPRRGGGGKRNAAATATTTSIHMPSAKVGFSEESNTVHFCLSSQGGSTSNSPIVVLLSYDVQHKGTLGEAVAFDTETLTPYARKVSGYSTVDGQHYIAVHDAVYASACAAAASTLSGAISATAPSTAPAGFVSIDLSTANLTDRSAWAEAKKKSSRHPTTGPADAPITAEFTKEAAFKRLGGLPAVLSGCSTSDASALLTHCAERKWWKAIAELFQEGTSLNIPHGMSPALLPAVHKAGASQRGLFLEACGALTGVVPAEVYAGCLSSLLSEKQAVESRDTLQLVDALATTGLHPDPLELALELDDGLTRTARLNLLDYLHVRLVARFTHPDPRQLDAVGVPSTECLNYFLTAVLDGSAADLSEEAVFSPVLSKLAALCDSAYACTHRNDHIVGQLSALLGPGGKRVPMSSRQAPTIDSKVYNLVPLRPTRPRQPIYSRNLVL